MHYITKIFSHTSVKESASACPSMPFTKYFEPDTWRAKPKSHSMHVPSAFINILREDRSLCATQRLNLSRKVKKRLK